MPVQWKDLDITEQSRIAAAYAAGYDLSDAAQHYGMKLVSLQRYCRAFLYYQRQFIKATAANIAIPDSEGPRYDNYLQLEGDDWLILSDLEVPDHDPVMLELALKVAMVQGIKRGVIAGDFHSMDGGGLTTWPETWHRPGTKNFEQALDMGRDILKQFLTWLDELYISAGNHDERVNKATKGAIHTGMLLNDLDVTYSHYRYLWIETSRGPVKVLHPQNYSATPVKLGQELYDVEPHKCHVVLGHTHIAQHGFTKDAAYEVVALGTMRDRAKTQYVSTGANKHHHWTQSFLLIKDSYLHHLPRQSTNWRLWLGDLYEGMAGRI